MNNFHRLKTGTIALLAMTVTTSIAAPIFTLAPVSAQLLRGSSRNVAIPAGVTIPVTYEKDKIVVTPDETASVTLEVASNIVDRFGNVLVPQGAEIVGEIRPATINGEKGSRFFAKELVYPNGNRVSIDAVSKVVTEKQKIRKGVDTTGLITDAAIGAGAASVIALLTGNQRIEALEPIGGAAVGAVASIFLRRREATVVVINPQQDLDLTLRSNLVVSR